MKVVQAVALAEAILGIDPEYGTQRFRGLETARDEVRDALLKAFPDPTPPAPAAAVSEPP